MYVQLLIVIVTCFLLFITPYRYTLNLFKSEQNSLPVKGIVFVMIFSLCSFCLFILNDLTLEPHEMIGKNNIGLFVIVPFLMLFTVYLTGLFFFVQDFLSHYPGMKSIFILLFLAVGTFSFIKTSKDSSALIEKLGGGPEEVQSIIYNLPWLNEYTYTMFFNMDVLFIITSVTFLCSVPFVHHPNQLNK